MESELFEKGLQVRRAVLGAEYVDGGLAKADDFLMAFQRITTEWCWGYAWTREGPDRKTRSMLNLAMLTALGRPAELQLHVKGALTNGVSVDEIKEILIHATVYCGVPAGLDAFKAAHEVLSKEGALTAQPATRQPRLLPTLPNRLRLYGDTRRARTSTRRRSSRMTSSLDIGTEIALGRSNDGSRRRCRRTIGTGAIHTQATFVPRIPRYDFRCLATPRILE